jgi:hypothetical protein
MATEVFAKWVRGFSGCDGGNLDGKIWICGIEYGGGDDEKSIAQELLKDVSLPPLPRKNHKDYLDYPYNRAILKILCSLSGFSGSYTDFFSEKKCFTPDSDYFKLNLYPLGFRAIEPSLWQECHAKLTGLETKDAYKRCCERLRFPWLNNLISRHEPALVLCTGTSYREQFFAAFSHGEHPAVDRRAGKPIAYTVTNQGKTLVAVTYFPSGPHGLNSNQKLSDAGRVLGQLLSEHLTPSHGFSRYQGDKRGT